MNNWDYPLGSDTVDAPWNRLPLEYEFGKEADDRLLEEIKDFGEMFVDFLADEYLCEFEDEITKDEYMKFDKKTRDDIESNFVCEKRDYMMQELYNAIYDN